MTFTPAPDNFKPKNPEYPKQNSRWIDPDTGLRKNFNGTLERPEFLKKAKHRGALTKKQKMVAAKVMYEAGWGSNRLKDWFKVAQPTITNWVKIPTPEALKEWEANFKLAMIDYDMEATFKIKNRIMDLVPNEDNIEKLVKAGQFFAGENVKRTASNNTQVNIYGDMLKKYKEVEVNQ